MEYEEKRELLRYVLHHFTAYLSDTEQARMDVEWERDQQAYREQTAQGLASAGISLDAAAFSRLVGEPAPPWRPPAPSDDYPADNYLEFLEGVAERVIRDLPPGISVHRCPKCHRVLRTPQAKLCLWCGHSEYEPSKPARG